MDTLKSLLALTEQTKKAPIKKAAKRVYHRDYEKTKNKPYRKYDPKEYKREKHLSEEIMNADQMRQFSHFLSKHRDHEADRNLRYDLHLLRLITNETQPRETEVTDVNGRKVVHFFYRAKDSEVFQKYKEMFGAPHTRSHADGELKAVFHDQLTGVDVTLKYSPHDQYFVGTFPLRSRHTQQVGEYYVQQIVNVAKFLTEGKMTGNDIFFMLIETPTIGNPYGGAAGADQNNGTADLRKDVTGLTDQIVTLRSALAQHLRADHHDWTYFSNASSVREAADRIVQIIRQQNYQATDEAIRETAEQVAKVYWGDDL